MEIEKYLQGKNLIYKASNNNQFILKQCPFCKDEKGHFYINQDSGLWLCFKCDSRGNYNDFRELFKDSPVKLKYDVLASNGVEKLYRELDANLPNLYAGKLFGLYPDDLKYLTETRKLHKETLENFKIGSTGQKISIPIFKNKKLVGIRYRRSPKETTGAKYTQEAYCRSELFNGDVIEDLKPKEIFITEGEIDAMTLWQQGYRNVVSTTLGAGFFPDDWIDRMKMIEFFYICYDNDEAGQQGAKKLAKKIGEDRSIIITLPLKQGRNKTDISEYFTEDGFTKKDFDKLLLEAKTLVQKDILHISELVDKLRELLLNGKTFGAMTGFDQMDLLVGGLRKGRLIILSGLTSAGKSSFSNCIGLNFAKRKETVLFFSLEMPPIDLAKKMLMLEACLTNEMIKNIKNPSAELEVVDITLATFKGKDALPIYIYAGTGEISPEVLKNSIKICVEKHSCRLVIIDHLHYFAHSTNNTTQETAQIIRKIKRIAVELNIPILLLAHLNRGGRTTQRRGLYIPTLTDLRDTSAAEQDADVVLFVCRDSESEDKDERSKVVLKVAKNRDGMAGRSISMGFDEDIGHFSEKLLVDYAKDAQEKKEEEKKEISPQEIVF